LKNLHSFLLFFFLSITALSFGQGEKMIYGEAISVDSSLIESISLPKSYTRLPKDINQFSNLTSIQLYAMENWDDIFYELSCLDSLKEIILIDSQLESLPKSLTLLPFLTAIHIEDNAIDQLPEWFIEFRELEKLTLKNNGTNVVNFDLSQLKKLRHLDLSRNKLVEISWKEENAKLERAYLQNNRLESIDPALFLGGGLTAVNLHSNRLNEIPVEIGLNENLQLLNLKNNGITQLPKELRSCKKLSYLNCSNNKLSDLAPIANLEQLEILKLSANKLNSFPSCKSYSTLLGLYLDGNELTELDKNAGRFVNLKILDLSFNQLKDISVLGSLAPLERLMLMENQIETVYFDAINWQKLRFLSLNGNGLKSIDKNIEMATSLEVVELRDNQLTDIDFCSQWTNLYRIDLGENELTKFPKSLLKLDQIRKIDIGYNSIKKIPKEVFELKAIEQLEFQDCGIAKLPAFNGNSVLKKLYLGKNDLNEFSLEQFPELIELELSDNPIGDFSIPIEYKFEWIDLSRTKISEELKESLRSRYEQWFSCQD
tara:strand:- start:94 stop:1722 length:1629 start_codon:yes stop_codon:yes gene_type:complete